MIPLYKFLGYAGALPFIICAVGMVLFSGGFADLLTLIQIIYSGLILSFLAGIHWTFSFQRSSEEQMLASMAPSIASLILLPLASYTVLGSFFGDTFSDFILTACLSLFLIGFAVLYLMDLQCLEREKFHEDYMDFRLRITVIVCLALLLSILSIWF